VRTRAALVALALAVGPLASGPAGTAATTRPRWDTRVFSLVPRPGYPAYAFAHPDGRVYAGTYTNPAGDSTPSRVLEWSRTGTLLRSWTVPGQDLTTEHGVQVAASDAHGRLVVLDKSTGRVLRLDRRTGRFTTYARVPRPGIPNYAAWGPGGALYVTDYAQGVLWKVPPGGGRPRAWLRDQRLDGGEFGTAGLVLAPGHRSLLVTQQSSMGLGETDPTTGKLYRLPIRADGRPGALRLLWESRPGDLPDGFGVAASGRIYVAAAGLANQIVVLRPDGSELERFPQTPGTGDNGSAIPFDTPSSATFSATHLLVANQSYLGDGSHHAILDVEVGEPGARTFVPDNAGD